MMQTGIPILTILFTVFQSILQVFLLSLAGFILSFKGIVDKPTSKALNHINVALFTPALLFSKVAYFLTPAKLRQLWVIPVFFVVLTCISALIANWLARACRLKQSQINFATAASMFMNSNSLPVALMQSLVTTVPLLKWGSDDTIDAMFGRSLTYLVVFSTLGMILRWSYGIRLISQVDEPEEALPALTPYRDMDDADEPPSLSRVATITSTTSRLVDYETETDVEPLGRVKHYKRPLRSPLHPRLRRHTYPHSHLHSHLPVVPTSLGDQSESDESDEVDTTEGDSEETIAPQSEQADIDSADPQCSTPLPLSSAEHPTPRWGQPTRPSIAKRILTTLTSLSPPLVGSILALICVLIPPIQRLLQSIEMVPFRGALDSAGACSIPVTLLVLGGWFSNGETKPKDKGKHTEANHVKDESSRQDHDHTKLKGKGVESRHGLANDNDPIRTSDPGQGHSDVPFIKHRSGHFLAPYSYSRNSSTTSLSSMIGAFGDVLIARIRARGPLRTRTKRHGHAKGVVPSDHDVEPGLLTTHVETANGGVENGRASSSRSRSRIERSPPALSSPTSVPSSSDSSHGRETNPPGENLTVFVALVSRMVIVPFVVTPMMVFVSRLGWGGEVFEDPVFVVSCMLLIASPPALTLAQVSQRTKATAGRETNTDTVSAFERLLSRTVFWSYCVLTPPLTIVSIMVGLLLVGA